MRSLNPAKEVWDEVFEILAKSNLNYEWLDLNCRGPPNNASIIVRYAKDKTFGDAKVNTDSLTSISYSEYYAKLFNISIPISEKVLYDEDILDHDHEPNAHLRTKFEPGTFF